MPARFKHPNELVTAGTRYNSWNEHRVGNESGKSRAKRQVDQYEPYDARPDSHMVVHVVRVSVTVSVCALLVDVLQVQRESKSIHMYRLAQFSTALFRGSKIQTHTQSIEQYIDVRRYRTPPDMNTPQLTCSLRHMRHVTSYRHC